MRMLFLIVVDLISVEKDIHVDGADRRWSSHDPFDSPAFLDNRAARAVSEVCASTTILRKYGWSRYLGRSDRYSIPGILARAGKIANSCAGYQSIAKIGAKRNVHRVSHATQSFRYTSRAVVVTAYLLSSRSWCASSFWSSSRPSDSPGLLSAQRIEQSFQPVGSGV